jgi:hypothetical protein
MNELYGALDGRGSQFEGVYLEIRDTSGQTLRVSFTADLVRSGAGWDNTASKLPPGGACP